MADTTKEDLESALQILVSVTELSKNLKKELKKQILESVSTIRNVFVKLENDLALKDAKNNELCSEVKKLEAELQNSDRLGTSTTGTQVLPSLRGNMNGGDRIQRQVANGSQARKLYSEVVTDAGKKEKRYKVFIKSRRDQTGEDIKKVIKTNVNPTNVKVGVCAMKSLRDGRVMIETSSKEEIERLTTAINEKCSEHLEAKIPKLWDPSLVVYNIPEEVTLDNAEEIIISQNPGLELKTGDLKPKFIMTNRKNLRNLVVTVNSQIRKQLLHTKLKIGWLICYAEDYVKVNRCYKCCRYFHKARDCRGEETCVRCAGNHNSKDCTVHDNEMRCVNCINYNKYNKQEKINENHSAFDRDCPCLHIATEKYKQNIDY